MKKILLLLACFSGASFAAAPDFDVLQAKVAEKLGMQIFSIADAPFAEPKLYQVSTERGLVYLSDDLRYLFFGKVYDTNSGFKDMTETALAGIRIDKLAKLKETAISFVAPKQKHEIFVFTDVSCGYCRKLHNEIDSYLDQGITVRYLAYPRGGQRSRAFSVMNDVWCAADTAKAMTDAKSDEAVPNSSCQSAVAEHYEIGNQFAVTGTPAIILQTGELVSGYLPAEKLVKLLESKG